VSEPHNLTLAEARLGSSPSCSKADQVVDASPRPFVSSERKGVAIIQLVPSHIVDAAGRASALYELAVT
jgi:hypothetical protein